MGAGSDPDARRRAGLAEVEERQRRITETIGRAHGRAWSPSAARERLVHELYESIRDRGERDARGEPWGHQQMVRRALRGELDPFCGPKAFEAFLGRVRQAMADDGDARFVAEPAAPSHVNGVNGVNGVAP